MLESMTGFGRCERSDERGTVLVEARSVNGRYVRLSVRAPDLLLSHENEIERLVRSRIGRGTVNVAVHLKTTAGATAWQINAGLLRSYARSLEALRTEVPASGPVQLEALAALPGAVEPAESREVAEAVWPLVAGALEEALDALVEMRRAEGRALADTLVGHLDEVERIVGVIARRAPEVLAAYVERLTARVQDLVGQAGGTVSDADLVREVAVFAERSDVTEELNRLRGHAEQFRALVAAAGQAGADQGKTAGRTLEFVIQEMLREANTIASKANDVDIAGEVVGLKTEIDRMKEQIQNVA